MKWFSLFLFLMSSVLTGVAVATESVSEVEASKLKRKTLIFAAPMWEGYTNKNGTGLYWDILKAVYEPLGFSLQLKNISWNRSMKLMTEYRSVDGVPGEGRVTDYEHFVFGKYPLEPEYLAIAYRPGNVDSVDKWPNLVGKIVGMRSGYNLLSETDRYGEFQRYEFINLARGLKLLESGVIDVLVDEMSEIEIAAKTAKFDLSAFETMEFFTGNYRYMTFNDSPQNTPLVKIFDDRMEALAKQGELQKFYEVWGVDMPEPLIVLSN